ncbi:unnamed protein product [Heterobilharzia americana]|nr:unnamed protein product [Heterobilharzia americana]
MKNRLEITRLLRLPRIGVVHKPTNPLQTQLYRPKETNQTSFTKSTTITVVNSLFDKVVGLFTFVYINTNWLLNVTHDISSLISMHLDNNYGHEFNFDNVEIMDGEREQEEYQRIPRSLAFTSVS